MNLSWPEKMKWGVGKWLWTRTELPLAEASPALAMKPDSKPVKNKTRRIPSKSRGSKGDVPKRVDKLFYRGPRLHHEIAEHHVNKAVLPFKGKGTHDRRAVKRMKVEGGT